ncbi:MAG: hypothetical protein ACRC33_26330, partial [Gemmataceae bacterium]
AIREQPASLLYEYCNRPVSTLLNEPGVTVSTTKTNAGLVHLAFLPTRPWPLSLAVDDNHRLVAFRILKPGSTLANQRVTEMREMEDYKSYADESGETIWFPSTVRIRFSLPEEDGFPEVVWGTATVRISDVVFNAPIPDSRFVISLPENATVYDKVTGQGFLPAGTTPKVWTDPPVTRTGYPWWWGVAAIAIMVLVGILYRWRASAREAAA